MDTPLESGDELAPFFAPSPLPYGAPPFDRISDAEFPAAFAEGIRLQREEVEQIATNPAPATFENTVLALETSGRMLERVTSAFFALTSAHTNPRLEKIEADVAPQLSELRDAIYLDGRLAERVMAVWEAPGHGSNDPESRRLTELTHQRFQRAGSKLADAEKVRLTAINSRLATLSTTFQQRLLSATKAAAIEIDDAARLAGMSESQIAVARESARSRGLADKWLLMLQNTTQQPALAFLEDRALRQELFERAWGRAEAGDDNDTRTVLLEIVALRAEKAALLRHADYASFALADQMAKQPDSVEKFLARLAAPVRARAAREAADIEALMSAGGHAFDLQPWDWEFYASALRKAQYDLDEADVRDHLQLETVMHDGLFYMAERLYGLAFRQRNDLPVYHPDVTVFEVFEETGEAIGLIYFDYFQRDSKLGGAWMGNFVEQSRQFGDRPVVYNVANFAKPPPGQPALLSFDDVITMFHEFGHALHGLLADGTYASLSGTNVARDFVELPSQFHEHWAREPSVLGRYARHWKTGAPMPAELAGRLARASNFNKGYDMGELVAAAALDLQWHRIDAGAAPADALDFEGEALSRAGVDFPSVPPRYRSSYFQHIFGGGYAAGYYAYLWTQMLADQAYAWCQANAGMTRANGKRFRELILARGRTLDYAEMFRAFCGEVPRIEPMLEARGLA